jgi:ankyrin repeat protein
VSVAPCISSDCDYSTLFSFLYFSHKSLCHMTLDSPVLLVLRIEKYPTVNQDSRTALMMAAAGGHASVVQLLLGHKANVNLADKVSSFEHAWNDCRKDILI